MKRATFALAFYVKRKKLLKNGEAPIFARVTVNGERAEFSVKRSINPSEWDTGRGRSSKKTKQASSLNEYLNEVWTRIQKHNDKLFERIGKGVARETWDRHVTSRKHFQDYLKQEYQRSDLAMTQKYARILDQKINCEMLANVAAKY